ncbi:MAG: hypothetical protein M1819_003165 [Sarea resinae]|nr:MAG: hypothetical protein M1819_003165 [Sarea resinae]
MEHNAPQAEPATSTQAPDDPLATTNNDLLISMNQLSLHAASATPLPPSPHIAMSIESSDQHLVPSGSHAHAPPHSPQPRRSPSSMSVHRRTSTPALNRKGSAASIHSSSGATPDHHLSRRSSSNLLNSPSSAMRTQLAFSLEEPAPPPPLTAAAVANAHFQKDLDLHHRPESQNSPRTIVVLHDSCYGHRYSRPRTSKAELNRIVERPERILASVLGVSATYVRLGARHAGGKHAPYPKQNMEHLSRPPFEIRKSSRSVALTSPVVTNVHGTKWMEELKTMCESAEHKLALNGKELARPAGALDANGEEKSELHEGDLYLCPESLEAFQSAIGGVCDAVDAVFQPSLNSTAPKRAFVAIRPPGHHCSADFPSGFCWVNNVHCGISHAIAAHGVTHAAIIDFDLHHGDGSQAITWAHNAKVARLHKNAHVAKKTSIGYFSLHDINSYPCEWGDEEKVRNASLCIENAHGQTIWNVHLQPYKTEAEFWDLYRARYMVLLDKARDFLRTHTQRFQSSSGHVPPKAAIFISAGFDASYWESPGMQRHKVNVPTEFYAKFTQDIVKLAEEDGLGVDGRVISVLEGGYSDRALTSGVFSHLSGLAGSVVDVPEEARLDGLGYEMGQRMGIVNEQKVSAEKQDEVRLNPNWWSLPRLEELETLVNPPPPAPAPKKTRNPGPPTFTAPTQSFSAKVVSSPKLYRNVSGSVAANGSAPCSRPPSPPPPEVDWATATYELSKLLIPSARQTRSCRPEELSVEASRAKKERHSTANITAEVEQPEGPRMQLRDRRAKPSNFAADQADEMSRSSRRRTIAVGPSADKASSSRGSVPPGGFRQPTEQSRRRLSVASSVGSVNGDESTLSSVPSAQALSGASAAVLGRPKSSTNTRPSVASAGQKSNGNIAVKKTRVATGTRPEVSSRARPGTGKDPAVSRVASAYSSSRSGSSEPALAAATSASESAKSSNASGMGKSTDLDNLTSGMKKMSIKLKVPPKEEQELREKKRAEAADKAARAPRKAAPSRTTKATAARKDPSPDKGSALPIPHMAASVPTPTPVAELSMSSGQPASVKPDQITPPKSTVPLVIPESTPQINETQQQEFPKPSHPESAPQTQESSQHHASNASFHLGLQSHAQPKPSPPLTTTPPPLDPTTNNNEFIPYSTHHIPDPPSAIKPQPLIWLPPNASTPKKEDLPVFSATGAIPFGTAPASKNTAAAAAAAATMAAAGTGDVGPGPGPGLKTSSGQPVPDTTSSSSTAASQALEGSPSQPTPHTVTGAENRTVPSSSDSSQGDTQQGHDVKGPSLGDVPEKPAAQ